MIPTLSSCASLADVQGRHISMLVQAGHALAAAAEGVGIHAVSFFLLLLLPGAYVTLNTDNLAVLGPSRALNVSSPPFWSLQCAQTPKLHICAYHKNL